MRILNNRHIGVKDQVAQRAGKQIYEAAEKGIIPQRPYCGKVICRHRDGTEEKEGTVFFPNSHMVLTDQGRIVVIFKTEAGKEE